MLYRIDKVPEEKLLVRTEEGGALATLRIRFEGEQLLLGAMRRQDGKKGRRVVAGPHPPGRTPRACVCVQFWAGA